MNHVHAIRGWVTSSRKRLVGTIGLLLAVTATGAYAAFLLFEGITGSVTAVDMNSMWSTSASYTPTVTATNTQYGGTCDVALTSAGELSVTMDGVAPDDSCEFSAAINYVSDVPLAFQTVDLLENEPAVAAALGADCGKQLAATDTAVNVPLTFTVTVTNDMSPGQTLTFDPASDGLTIVPQTDYDPALCA